MKKKIMSVVMSIVMLFGMAFSFTGCSIESRFESDGKFKYYYDNSKKGYVIVGTKEAGFSDPMYLPAYYKGKSIVGTYYYEIGFYFGVTYYSIDYGNAKKIYYPFSIPELGFIKDSEVYLSATEGDPLTSSFYEFDSGKNTVTYMNLRLYDTVLNSIKKQNVIYYENHGVYKYVYEDCGDSFKFHGWGEVEKGSSMIIVRKANTSYMFNYEDAPNNNYFFINNFENGALIENTPYEPLREGYKFDGWYKEPECINKCNFGIDTYVEQYDENGELIFNELKLYAKWRGKNFLGF